MTAPNPDSAESRRAQVPWTVSPPRVIVSAGTVGGAGATTVAILVGALLAEQCRRRVLILDATPAGGDLMARVFGTGDLSGPHWDSWVRAGADTLALAARLGGREWGVLVLGQDTPAPDAGGLLRSAIDAVAAQDWVVVVDVGSGAVAAPALATAIAADATLLLSIPQRADGANRARWYLSALAGRYGRTVIDRAIVAVIDQDARHPHVFGAVRAGLDGKAATVLRVPPDPQLAAGCAVNPPALMSATRAAVRTLVDALAQPALRQHSGLA
jgi:MinD-like ATPase involved in chromosome partitioning or flagellar assembly